MLLAFLQPLKRQKKETKWLATNKTAVLSFFSLLDKYNKVFDKATIKD